MLRNWFRPRLWWVLVLPLGFYLTHGRYVFDKLDEQHKVISLEVYDQFPLQYDFKDYFVLGGYYSPNAYHVWQFMANACLVIGCLALGKALLLNKSAAPQS
jgi:hypothetical protein